jgi:hypothetical protein
MLAEALAMVGQIEAALAGVAMALSIRSRISSVILIIAVAHPLGQA